MIEPTTTENEMQQEQEEEVMEAREVTIIDVGLLLTGIFIGWVAKGLDLQHYIFQFIMWLLQKN